MLSSKGVCVLCAYSPFSDLQLAPRVLSWQKKGEREEKHRNKEITNPWVASMKWPSVRVRRRHAEEVKEHNQKVQRFSFFGLCVCVWLDFLFTFRSRIECKIEFLIKTRFSFVDYNVPGSIVFLFYCNGFYLLSFDCVDVRSWRRKRSREKIWKSRVFWLHGPIRLWRLSDVLGRRERDFFREGEKRASESLSVVVRNILCGWLIFCHFFFLPPVLMKHPWEKKRTG